MASLPEAFVAHVSHGRVRIKIPAKKNDRDYFSQLKKFLEPWPGIKKVETNPLTGSVLVLHTLDLKNSDEIKTVSNYSEMLGLFKVAPTETSNTPVARSLAGGFAGLNQSVKGVTAGAVDLPTLGFFGLLSIGIWQMSRGEVAVPAITALWYASTILKEQLADEKKETPTRPT
jgi:hypothetical protein